MFSSFARAAAQKASQQTTRQFSSHHGPMPGPSPVKEGLMGIGLGVLFGLVWKNWQWSDKARRLDYEVRHERWYKIEQPRRDALIAAAAEEEAPADEE